MTVSSPQFLARNSGAPLVAKAFEDGGKHYTALSTTFLLACLYVLVAVSSTNHRILLLGGTLSLPLVNVPTSLTGFFVLAPVILLVLHVNLLVQHHVLVRRLLDRRRLELGPGEDLLLFPSLPFLDNLWRDRPGFAFLVSAALSSSSIVLPLGVLCYTQYKFVPYHSFKITLCHQIVIVFDLVILWYFRSLIPGRRLGRIGMSLATACVVFFSFFLAICPRTWIEMVWMPFPPATLLTRNLSLAGERLISEPPPAELLVALKEEGQGRAAEFGEFYSGVRLVGRDLRDADLEGAILFGADLRGADLRGASLADADLRRANLTPLGETALMQERRSEEKSRHLARLCKAPGELRRTRLERADLRGARFNGSNLILARLRGADLRGAQLPGVELTGADLRESRLERTMLDGAELSCAKLDRAQANHVELNRAVLAQASLVDASLRYARASGVSFVEAGLEGAQLTEARLRGSDFRNATLVGSDFRGVSLQNARSLRLEAVDLRGAHLGGVCGLDFAGLTDLRGVDFHSVRYWDALLEQAIKNLVDTDPLDRRRQLESLSAANPALEIGDQAICLGTTSTEYRRLLYHDEDRKGPLKDWPPLAKQWGLAWNEAEFHRQLATRLLDQACRTEGLALTLFRRAAGEQNPGDLSLDLELARQLTRRLVEGTACPWLQGLDEARKRRIVWRLRRTEREQER